MDYNKYVNGIQAMGSLYSFEVMADGSFGELKLMALNQYFAGVLTMVPNAPEFYPGIPYRNYFTDVNFESFCYKCAMERKPLYSYVNAHGSWLTGLYIPIENEDGDSNIKYCLYVLNSEKDVNSDLISHRSHEVSEGIMRISTRLHENKDFYTQMAETVVEIKSVCNSQMSSVVIVDMDTEECTMIHDSGVDNEYLGKIADDMGCTPYELALRWEKNLADSDCLILKDLKVVEERDPVWAENLKKNGISSIVLYQIKFNEKLVGFIWAANFSEEQTMRIKETLEFTTFLIGAVIANHQFVDKLAVMSTVDMLTKVNNRNAMNKRIDSFIDGTTSLPKTMGVVFIDINGLKTVNDESGHNAGDKLLAKAAKLLKEPFWNYEIYRAGGDEFVILCPDISEGDFASRITEAKALADKTYDVSFAVGVKFLSGKYDIIRGMQIADERMYKDKEEYYKKNPDKDRRRFDR